MSHEITIREDGFAEAAFSLNPAWHGLGTVFDHMMSSSEALTAAGLDWRVLQRPVAVGHNRIVDAPELDGGQREETVWAPQPQYVANVREDNGLVMGMVTDHYKVVQNTEAFQFLDALVDAHEMKYESAFSLYGGRRVVMLAQMPGVDRVVEGDDVLRYILLSLSHDGTESVRFGPTAVRVVCANTYSLAVGRGGTRELSIRHCGDIKSKLAQARDILGVASQQFAQYAEHSQALAARRLTREEWREFLNVMCPELSPLDPDYTERRADALAETRMSITRAYHNERQATAPQTAWAAYNAVAEHIDHLPRRGGDWRRKAEARFNVCLYGTGMNMKERAFKAACKVAGLELAG